MSKRKFFHSILIITMFFSTLVFSGVESNTVTAPVFASQETMQKPAPISAKEPQSIPEKNIYKLNHIDKKNGLFSFFMAMLGVLVSTVIIFVSLKLYKKFAINKSSQSNSENYKNSLDSPKDFKEAINLFLNKTNK